MIELVTRNHWWPGVTKNIGKYVDITVIIQTSKY